jgi:hypothetical protein
MWLIYAWRGGSESRIRNKWIATCSRIWNRIRDELFLRELIWMSRCNKLCGFLAHRFCRECLLPASCCDTDNTKAENPYRQTAEENNFGFVIRTKGFVCH